MRSSIALIRVAPRLKKLLPVLSSDQTGEVLSAVAAIGRTLASAGLTWHDLAAALEPAAPPPHPRANTAWAMAERLRTNAALSPWEKKFIASVLEQMRCGRQLSAKQAAIVEKIYSERLGGSR